MVFTGNGKGKTTAAFGTATRAVGHGKKSRRDPVYQGDRPNGERNLLEPHGVEFQVMATGFTRNTQDRDSDTAACLGGLGSMPAVCSLTTSSIWCCWTS